MESREIPARIVADVAGASVDDLRTWRALGYSHGFGERVGAGTRFSRRETLAIVLAVTMARGGLGLRAAFEMVAEPPPEIIAALAGHGGRLILRPQGGLACPVTLTFDLAEIVGSATKRLDAALEAEPHRRRFAFAQATMIP
jgi:hypothetical protein